MALLILRKNKKSIWSYQKFKQLTKTKPGKYLLKEQK